MPKYLMFLPLFACTYTPRINYAEIDSGNAISSTKEWFLGKGCAGITCYSADDDDVRCSSCEKVIASGIARCTQAYHIANAE
jgi:hypothetical protein